MKVSRTKFFHHLALFSWNVGWTKEILREIKSQIFTYFCDFTKFLLTQIVLEFSARLFCVTFIGLEPRFHVKMIKIWEILTFLKVNRWMETGKGRLKQNKQKITNFSSVLQILRHQLTKIFLIFAKNICLYLTILLISVFTILQI